MSAWWGLSQRFKQGRELSRCEDLLIFVEVCVALSDMNKSKIHSSVGVYLCIHLCGLHLSNPLKGLSGSYRPTPRPPPPEAITALISRTLDFLRVIGKSLSMEPHSHVIYAVLSPAWCFGDPPYPAPQPRPPPLGVSWFSGALHLFALFFHPPVDVHNQGYFCFLAIMNTAAIHIIVQVLHENTCN